MLTHILPLFIVIPVTVCLLEGYIILCDNDIAGYVMLAKSFSTEFGKNCIWFEDLYLKENYRNKGVIPNFINFVKQKYPDKILKLEVEKENYHAIHIYEKAGFREVPYKEYYFNSGDSRSIYIESVREIPPQWNGRNRCD